MLALRIEYLTGRCVATAYNNRERPEWPPHPARVFSALVASWADGDTSNHNERAALEWLENAGAPFLTAAASSSRTAATHYVPVNDAVLPVCNTDRLFADFAKAEAAVDSGRSDAEREKAGKSRDKALKQILNAATTASKTLPEHRVRQPRFFPSLTPDDPVVHLVWKATPLPEHREALAQLAGRVVRIGHSSSLVSCSVVDNAPEPSWYPDANGEEVLRVPGPGQLTVLEAEWERHQGTEPRVLPCLFVRYRNGSRTELADVVAPVMDDRWEVFRRVGGPRLPITRTVDLASAVRGALLKHADDPPPEVLSGHRPDGSPSERPHISIVPLPFVGSAHADGALLGLAVVLPRELAEGERLAALRAIGKWEETERVEDEEAPSLSVQMGSAGVVEIERVVWGIPPLANLRSSTWCRPSRLWISATPVALDRNPGDLYSPNPDKAKKAFRTAAETIARACENIGLPLPQSVTVLPSATLPGTTKARQFPPFPKGKEGPRRVKVHAGITFREVVRGPVLLGAGRYLGLGLFRPFGDGD